MLKASSVDHGIIFRNSEITNKHNLHIIFNVESEFEDKYFIFEVLL